jgi:glycosyltransferase involved in cell wall biosynthesis
MKKLISIITPTYNEEENVLNLIKYVKEIMLGIDIDYVHLFIDNASTDNTISILESQSLINPHLRIILNNQNYGQLLSPYHALLNCEGDAAIIIAADFEDPPEIIPNLINEWRKGFQVVCAQKNASNGDNLKFFRQYYYIFLELIAGKKIIKNFSGYGIYDRSVIDIFKNNFEPSPYLRGLIVEYGFTYSIVYYKKNVRKKGISKNNLITLFDVIISGLLLHVKKPLRILFFISLIFALPIVLIYDLIFIYDYFFIVTKNNLGDKILLLLILNLIIFLIISLCILSEYISIILQHIEKKPLVLERKRIGFKE